MVVIYAVCSHSKVTNIALQHLKRVEATNPRFQDVYCMCKTQWYIISLLLLILLGILFIGTNKIRKSNLLRAHLFSNITKVMLFILDTQSYVLVNLCKIAGIIHLFRIRGRLTPECINVKRNWIWVILEIVWEEVRVTLNGNEVNLPTSVVILFRDKFVTRHLITKQPLFLHVMLKQGKTWFTLENDNRDQSPATSTLYVTTDRKPNKKQKQKPLLIYFIFILERWPGNSMLHAILTQDI